MGDPVAAKNAKRLPPTHRIEDIRIRGESAFVACSCGWINYLAGDSEPSHVEEAWNAHRREHGTTRTH